MKDFKVCVRRSEIADKCAMKGYYLMRTDYESLLLKEPRTGEVLFTWPYRFLRRFGRDKVALSKWILTALMGAVVDLFFHFAFAYNCHMIAPTCVF